MGMSVVAQSVLTFERELRTRRRRSGARESRGGEEDPDRPKSAWAADYHWWGRGGRWRNRCTCSGSSRYTGMGTRARNWSACSFLSWRQRSLTVRSSDLVLERVTTPTFPLLARCWGCTLAPAIGRRTPPEIACATSGGGAPSRGARLWAQHYRATGSLGKTSPPVRVDNHLRVSHRGEHGPSAADRMPRRLEVRPLALGEDHDSCTWDEGDIRGKDDCRASDFSSRRKELLDTHGIARVVDFDRELVARCEGLSVSWWNRAGCARKSDSGVGVVKLGSFRSLPVTAGETTRAVAVCTRSILR